MIILGYTKIGNDKSIELLNISYFYGKINVKDNQKLNNYTVFLIFIYSSVLRVKILKS